MATTIIGINGGKVLGSPFDGAPKLMELFIPCPICHGTTDVDDQGNAFCCSCGQRWTIFGEPLKTEQMICGTEESTAEDLIFT